jgi:hypothetical protein
VAIFAHGPLHDETNEFEGAREQLDKELAKFPWLTPKMITIFGGKLLAQTVLGQPVDQQAELARRARARPAQPGFHP